MLKKGSTEWRKNLSERMKAYWKARHAEIPKEQTIVAEVTVDKTDYKKLYVETNNKLIAAENKIAEYENLCKSYAQRMQNAENALKGATLEYNARIKYMLDCSKHAYISMQFAAESKGEKQND